MEFKFSQQFYTISAMCFLRHILKTFPKKGKIFRMLMNIHNHLQGRTLNHINVIFAKKKWMIFQKNVSLTKNFMLYDLPVLSHLQKFLRILVNSRNSVMCYGGQLDYKVECSYYYVQLLNKYFDEQAGEKLVFLCTIYFVVISVRKWPS